MRREREKMGWGGRRRKQMDNNGERDREIKTKEKNGKKLKGKVGDDGRKTKEEVKTEREK